MVDFIIDNLKLGILCFFILIVLSFFIEHKVKRICTNLHIREYIQRKIIFCSSIFNTYYVSLVIIFLMVVPIINIIVFMVILFLFMAELDEDFVNSEYKVYLNHILKEVKANEDEAFLIYDSILNINTENHFEILEKFIEMAKIVEGELDGDKYKKKQEILNFIEKSTSFNGSKLEKDIIDKSFKLRDKEIKEYITNLETNKQAILKYLDNQTEGIYISILEFALSKDKNPYYNVIIENAYILTSIIKDFENNNYILNEDRKTDIKSKIKESIFEFIDVIKLIDGLNYKEDSTIKNVENYNEYLENIKSDIKNKIAIFGTEEYSI